MPLSLLSLADRIFFGTEAAGARRCGNNFKRTACAVRFAFFEVTFDAGHLVRHMGKAQHGAAACARKSIECRRLHFHRERSMRPRGSNGVPVSR
jgi:hypothetical protein